MVGEVGFHALASSQDVYNEAANSILAGKPLIASMMPSIGDGHTVEVYGIEPGSGPGDFYLDVYDPNRDYNSGEEINIDPTNNMPESHLELVKDSRIHVMADGSWSFYGDFSDGNDDFNGHLKSLTLMDPHVDPLNPTLPSVLGVLSPFGDSQVTQVSDAAGQLLLDPDGTVNTDPKTMMPNSTPLPLDEGSSTAPFVIGPSDVTLSVKSTGKAFGESFLQNGFGAILQSGTDPAGANDQIGFNSANDSFSFTTSGPARSLAAELIATPTSGPERTALFNTTTFTNAGDTVAFDASKQNVVVNHKGAASTFSLTLTQADAAGNMETFSTGAMKLAAGDSVVLAPSSWTSLNGSTVAVTVTHSNGTKTVESLKNQAPSLSLSAVEGKTFSGSIANFVPPTALAAKAYSVSIDWGDGSAATVGTITANKTGGFSVNGTHLFTKAGYFYPTYTVTAAGNTVTTGTARIAVSEAALTALAKPVSLIVGQTFSGVVATITDANTTEIATELTASINWGDGTTSAGQVVRTGPGTFNITGSHAYAKAGSFSIVTQVTDGATDQKTSGTKINATTTKSFTGVVGGLALPEPGTPLADYIGTIAWGDGTTSAATLSLQNGNIILFHGTHTYAKAGTYAPQLELKGGFTATAKGTASIVAVPSASITGTVFDDANQNGKKDSTEPALQGWKVYIDANHNGQFDAGEKFVYTNGTGTYAFTYLPAGTYVVREILPANWKQTASTGAAGLSVILASGQQLSGANFGNYTAVKYLSTVATTAGLAAWWTFDATSGANSIVNGITGTLKGGASLSTSAGAPLAGESANTGLLLNGTNAFVDTNLITQYEFPTAATFNVWINLARPQSQAKSTRSSLRASLPTIWTSNWNPTAKSTSIPTIRPATALLPQA